MESNLETLRKDNSSAVIKNLNNAVSIIDDALRTIAIVKPDAEKNTVQTVAAISDEQFEKIEKKISDFNQLKSIYDAKGVNQLSGLLPAKEWLNNPLWVEFIEKSLSFVESLDENKKIEFKTEKCAYCGQPYTTEKAKELIKAYWSLRDNTKNEIDKLTGIFLKTADVLRRINEAVLNLFSKWNTIKAEQENVSNKIPEAMPFDEFRTDLQSLISAIEKKSSVKAFSNIPNRLSLIVSELCSIRGSFNAVVNQLESASKDKTKAISEIELKKNPLVEKKALTDSKTNLLEYLKIKSTLDGITDQLSSLSALKQVTNTTATRFSKEVPLDVFKGFLQDEYDALGFSPPAFWKINCSTSDVENKRVYTLADKRLADIFSESERKIHALADFFAQAQINAFKGVYIFDDPVNSLDEERMEKVKHRLVKLVEDGNQVIVFTHNILFLNYLIDTGNDKVTRISKLENQIILEPDVSLGKEADLKNTMKEIDKRFSEMDKKKELQGDVYCIKNLYDLMSGYLESFVEYYVFKDIVSRYRPNIRMHSLDKLSGFDSTQLKTIMQIYEETSRKCSRHSQPAGAPEPTYSDVKTSLENIKKLRPK